MTVDEVYGKIITLVDKTESNIINSIALYVEEFPKLKKDDVIEISIGINIMPKD